MILLQRFPPGLLLAALFAWGPLACSSDSGPTGSTPGPNGLTTRLTLSPAQPAPGTRFTAELGFELSGSSAPRLGAYVVELSFAPARVRYIAGDPGLDDHRVVNDRDAATGSLVVAGASDAGFSDGLLFRGTFEGLAADLTAADLTMTVREATATDLQDLLR